jgi:C-terminal processing protease CtpA/Prc
VSLRIAAGRLVLRIVQPDSPAARAGLRRGDRVVSIDGVDAAALIAAGTVSAALGPSQAGLVVRMDVERDGARREVAIGKAEYAVAPVLATRVIDRPAGKVGYVALYTFTEPARAAWGEAIATVRAAGARRLVVDLRDNGGGRLHVAAEIAGSLAPAAAVGQPFTVLRHNARRAADDLTIPVPAHAATGAFERVAWLVSDASCSASESLIAGLRPYRDDPVIGTATCGKPVGSEPRTRGDVVLSAVTFASRNRDGLTDWFDGLPPTCAVADEPFVAFGDETDPRLAEALARLETGACRSATKALPRGGPTTPAAGGLAGETGLH